HVNAKRHDHRPDCQVDSSLQVDRISADRGDGNAANSELDRHCPAEPCSGAGDNCKRRTFSLHHAHHRLPPLAASAITSPTRSAFAAIVKLGLIPSDVGMNDESVT